MAELVNIARYKNKIRVEPVVDINGQILEDFAFVIVSNSMYYLVYGTNLLAESMNVKSDITLYGEWYGSPESVKAVVAFFKRVKCFYKNRLTVGDQRAEIWGMIYRGEIDYEQIKAKIWDFV